MSEGKEEWSFPFRKSPGRQRRGSKHLIVSRLIERVDIRTGQKKLEGGTSADHVPACKRGSCGGSSGW